jgi:hypothetical protein
MGATDFPGAWATEPRAHVGLIRARARSAVGDVAALGHSRRSVLIALSVALSIAWALSAGAAAAGAQAIPLCLKGGDADFSIQALLKQGQTMECGALNVAAKTVQQQSYGYCPPDAAYCDVTMQGSVGSEATTIPSDIPGVPLGYARDVRGDFEILGEMGIGGSKVIGASRVITSDSCTIEGSTNFQEHHVTCSKILETQAKSYRWISGRCVATAGAYRGFAGGGAADPATHIDLQFCKFQVTPYYVPKGCRMRLAADVSQRLGLPMAVVASRSCRVKKGKPVSPPKGVHPPSPPRETFPPPSDRPPDCTKDDPEQPPTPGCVRVTVRVIPAPLPSDPENESIGVGVGTATLAPGGQSIECLNPANVEACVVTVDLPADTPASVSAQPGSLGEDPSSPPDSAFWKFAGACTGTGTCTFTATSAATVDVYFIPAMVTLTLEASDDGEGPANMTANEFDGGGLEPMGPVYCGSTYPTNPLPCKVMVRVEKFAQVEANTAGDESITFDGFSPNCTPSTQGPSFCQIRMTSDQTVTAMFGGVGGLAR